MSNGPTKPTDFECNGNLKPFERNRYFYGKLLTVRDFETEQRYFIDKQRLMNRLIHGSGVVCGLKVENKTGAVITVRQGVALDCCGREIVVPAAHDIDLSKETIFTNETSAYIVLKYDWCGKEKMPNVSDVSSCEETCCYGRIMESYKIEVVKEKPEECGAFDNDFCKNWNEYAKKSDDLIARKAFIEMWAECASVGSDPGVVLAKVTKNGSSYAIDNTVRTLVFSNPGLYQLITCAKKEFPVIKGINWEHNKEYICEMKHQGTVKAASAGNITLADDASRANDEYKGMTIEIIEGIGIGQSREITAYNGTTQVADVKRNWDTTPYTPNSQSKYRIIKNEYEDFFKKLEKLEITFDGNMDKATINAKTLNVVGLHYAIGTVQDFHNVEAIMQKMDMPLHFYPDVPEDQVHFRVLLNPFAQIRQGRQAVKQTFRQTFMETSINRVTDSMYAPAEEQLPWEWEGYRALILLKGDFVSDRNAHALDGNFLGGVVPTGNETSGGLFESWFDLKMSTNLLFYHIRKARDYIIATNAGVSAESIEANIIISKEISGYILNALVRNKAIYYGEERYYPLPNPGKTIVVFDGNYAYLKESAERLKADLKEKGVTAEIKNTDELTDDDKKNYEMILLRGSDVKSTTTEKLRDVETKMDWKKSSGDMEIVKNPYIKDSNVFIIGGKDAKAVTNAVNGFLERYKG